VEVYWAFLVWLYSAPAAPYLRQAAVPAASIRGSTRSMPWLNFGLGTPNFAADPSVEGTGFVSPALSKILLTLVNRRRLRGREV
jgi:hypothetical protein